MTYNDISPSQLFLNFALMVPTLSSILEPNEYPDGGLSSGSQNVSPGLDCDIPNITGVIFSMSGSGLTGR